MSQRYILTNQTSVVIGVADDDIFVAPNVIMTNGIRLTGNDESVRLYGSSFGPIFENSTANANVGNFDLVVGASGTIDAARGQDAVSLNGGANVIVNQGEIDSIDASAIKLDTIAAQAGLKSKIVNQGTINTIGDEAAIWGNNAAGFSIVNRGVISAVSTRADSGLAIQLGDGNDIVKNFQILEGDVHLGSGDDLFDNQLGGSFDSTLLAGAGNDTIFGGSGNAVINGGDGNDRLDGGSGADELIGGLGDDQYFVDDAGDFVDEATGGGGSDVVRTTVDFDLSNLDQVTGTIERLIVDFSASGWGTSGNDVMIATGSSGALDGRAGNDQLYARGSFNSLTGGDGKDRFVFDRQFGGPYSVVEDFEVGIDKIALENSVFKRLPAGALSSGNFAVNAPSDGNDFIIYNQFSGGLFYDPDGNGIKAATQFAQLAGAPTISSSDLTIF